MLVFSSTPGVVGAVVTGQSLPFTVAVGGTPDVPAFPAYMLARAVLTGFRMSGRSGLGVTTTLRDRIYLYVFGEQPGQAEVSGVAFAGVCDASGTWTGFDAIHAYYERVRVSSQGLPVRLVFGPDTTLYGFMSGFDFSLEDPQSGIGSFSFKFVTMPRVRLFGTPRPLPWESQPAPEPTEPPPET